MPAKSSIVIVTGLSGSGKTVALRAMEDSGFTCVDNLPPELIDAFVSNVSGERDAGSVAVGIDIRKKDFLDDLDAALPPLREKYDVTILFLDAERDVLVRRFKETRRPHPLMSPDVKEIQEAIQMEKGMLLTLREKADTVLDTSSLTPHQLRQQMMSRYGEGGEGDALRMTLMSFGFKYGVPNNVDMLLDVRFLPNPHFVPELKDLSGLDAPVREFVLEKAEAARFLEKVRDFLDFLIPLFRKEGKAYLTIGIGCTGGRHRSAAIVEEVASILRKDALRVTVIHRDI
jgi:UPF0042 nucleotide-binding protein